MLCATCGEKVQFVEGTFICKMCDSEYDALDMEEDLIPEPIYITIRLKSQYAILDTRKQMVFTRVNTFQKSQLITTLLNQHISQRMKKKYLIDYLNHR